MKDFIKAYITGIAGGMAIMLILIEIIQVRHGEPFAVGGEILLPALTAVSAYSGWRFAMAYCKKFCYSKIYGKGFRDGTKVHSYRIISSREEEFFSKTSEVYDK